MVSTSPLRYPGGKARFTKFITEALQLSGVRTNLFIEPFCGGAGASILLLENEVVDQIALNDVDPLVSSFWKVVFGKGDNPARDLSWLMRRIEAAKFSVDEWHLQKALEPNNLRDAAWKCLYINRTSFNGILHKAGPIGGFKQLNRTLDVRFNKLTLLNRIQKLYDLRSRVKSVSGVSWRKFCAVYNNVEDAYYYFDPPYFNKAHQLYKHSFDFSAHTSLRDYLQSKDYSWMLSYDDAPEIRKLYSNVEHINGRVIDHTYSAHPLGSRIIGRELFYSNRKLPLDKTDIQRPHAGLTVVGCITRVKTNVEKVPRLAPPRLGALAI